MISLRRIKPSTSIIFSHFSSSSSSSSSSRISNGSWDPSASLSLNHPTLILLEKPTTTIHHFKQILSQMMRLHLITQTFPMSRLLYFSAISHPHCLDNAILLFNHFTPCPNLFIFNTMISALSFSPLQSLRLYETMLSYSFSPDQHTLLSLLKSSHSLSLGANVHAHVIVFGLHSQTYREMKEHGTAPNSVTFIAVLIACSHAGLVEQGYEIFKDMKERYGIEPGLEHYGCLVDLFGRLGRVKDAVDVIRRMPMKPTQSIWGAVLSASKEHKDLRIAEDALRELMVLEPEKEGGYVLLSNAYASFGQWRCSDEVREIMGRRGIKKIAGCSSLVVGGVANEFLSADKRHPRIGDIYSMLDGLHGEMKSGAELI